ncbi:hemagglutinin repeat-containing protein, partial [bacterium]|nr:hemagglutinin repeat-containing protein [bacterium]
MGGDLISFGVSPNTAYSVRNEAALGVKAKTIDSQSSSNRDEKTALTSSYQAGGNISSTTTGKTTLDATKMVAGDNISITAESLDFKQTANTLDLKRDANKGSAEIKVKYVPQSNSVGMEFKEGYEHDDGSKTVSKAIAGMLNAGSG